MQQVPVLVLPNGELMTESAAILIHLADSHPAARLSPTLDDPRRPRLYQEAPKMAEVVRRVDHDPRLAQLWAERLG
jgi:glutathione S-transferase